MFEEFWKQGVKRSLLTEAKGIPLSVVVDGANRHDMKLVKETLASLQADRPPAAAGLPQGVCLDNWMNRFRRILVRWEKLAGTYLAMLHLACALITWRAVGLSK